MSYRPERECIICGAPTYQRKTCSEACLTKLRRDGRELAAKEYYDIFDGCVRIHPSMTFKITDIWKNNQDKFKDLGLGRTQFLHFFTYYIIEKQFLRANETKAKRQYWVPDKWRDGGIK